MSHEITATDGLVLTREKAWHGLGVVVQDAPSPREALKLASLDWTVDLWPMFACQPTERGPSFDAPIQSDRYGVVRHDTRECLGVVGPKYEVCQNAELADFCEALSKEGAAKIESAGSIRGGRKVWFLLQKGSIVIRERDEVRPYLLVASSHDGSTKIRVQMTSTRVVCSNTLHLALGMNGHMKDAIVEVMHSGDMTKKLRACHEAVECFSQAVKYSGEKMKHLAERAATVDDLRTFWAAAYQRDFGPIPTNPITTIEQRHYVKAMESFVAVEKRFTAEKKIAGSTWWNVMNAYTGYLQNDLKVRAANAEARLDKATDQKLFGVTGARSSQAWRDALALAG